MVKAEDLVKKQKEKKDLKIKTFERIYEILEKRIVMASTSDYYHVWYEIPEYLLGEPFYKIKDCKEYIILKLSKNNFKTEFYEPNFLLIRWDSD